MQLCFPHAAGQTCNTGAGRLRLPLRALLACRRLLLAAFTWPLLCARQSLLSLLFHVNVPVILDSGLSFITSLNIIYLFRGPVSNYRHSVVLGIKTSAYEFEGSTIYSVILVIWPCVPAKAGNEWNGFNDFLYR